MTEKKHILIAEDSPDQRLILQRLLEKNDFQVTVTTDGLTCLNEAKRLLPDCILLDVMMPAMNGLMVCGLLKNDKKTAHIPIAIISAKKKEEDIERSQQARPDAYITKPVHHQELISTIRQLLPS